VLLARQADGTFPPFPIWGDVQTFDGKPWRGIVDIVAGGFPCQDISIAGKGAGIDGKRSGLWSHFARIIGEIRPRYAFIENSPMLVNRGLDRVLCDLASLGFDAQWCVLGADDCDASHERKRCFILANSNAGQRDRKDDALRTGRDAVDDGGSKDDVQNAFSPCDRGQIDSFETDWQKADRPASWTGRSSDGARKKEMAYTANTRVYQRRGFDGAGESMRQLRGNERHGIPGSGQEKTEVLANSNSNSIQGLESKSQPIRYGRPTGIHGRERRLQPWPADPADVPESRLGRVANGVANRTHRIKAIGNGQVPRVAATAFDILLKEIQS